VEARELTAAADRLVDAAIVGWSRR